MRGDKISSKAVKKATDAVNELARKATNWLRAKNNPTAASLVSLIESKKNPIQVKPFLTVSPNIKKLLYVKKDTEQLDQFKNVSPEYSTCMFAQDNTVFIDESYDPKRLDELTFHFAHECAHLMNKDCLKPNGSDPRERFERELRANVTAKLARDGKITITEIKRYIKRTAECYGVRIPPDYQGNGCIPDGLYALDQFRDPTNTKYFDFISARQSARTASKTDLNSQKRSACSAPSTAQRPKKRNRF